ncbi:preprotein translocase subunit SecD [Haloarchaeobius salinus]|uniref:preprotein translocase subunit SecD n=1 Tax=Haloarchaeobius salinus TaxID=1198298 RepID=UPI00210C861E|nr:preprotein translocase subunit SecD [Haloarchaeobius salinus]
MNVRENWRVLLLAVMLVASGVILFVPGVVGGGGGDGDTASQGMTNLQYGIELDGGTRLRAPVVGMTAEDVSFAGMDGVEESQRRQGMATDLGVPTQDVYFQPEQGTVEVFNKSVSESEFASALNGVGFRTADGEQFTENDIRDGVTDATRQQIVDTLDRKLAESGLTAGSARVATTPQGQNYIVIEAPNQGAEELEQLVSQRGSVQLVARYPGDNGTMEETTLVTEDGIDNVDSPEAGQSSPYEVPVVLKQDAANQFARVLNQNDFTTTGVESRTCGGAQKNDQGYCLLTVVDGEVASSHSLGASLADSIRSGQFQEDPRFVMGAQNRSEAQTIAVSLRAGALRAPLDTEGRQVYTLEPALADRFKLNSLITGIVAVLAVSGVVYLRYGKPRVAVPMVLTALAEVVLLLAFVAGVRLPLDLSHMAGFIAVIGTGVDDLIIIADEVMAEGEVNSTRVFQSRFRKAFWVIGAAAATTIIAMSPLAVLSLGDLRGFAIVTILGVLIGVLVTRPAYGDILRWLSVED